VYIINWDEWQPLYKEIKKKLSLNFSDDEMARDIALSFAKTDASSLNAMFFGKKCYVFGNADSLEADLQAFVPDSDSVTVAADGSIQLLLGKNIIPDVIVSDLDGDVESMLVSEEKGSVIVLLVHGDNIDLFKKHVSSFKNPIITTQIKPEGLVFNFGGFTDGDRCCFLAQHFGAVGITLVGFDFARVGSRYTKNPRLKQEKLAIAKWLISDLKRKLPIN